MAPRSEAWIVTFNSFKGGSGRSTTCLNVAARLAAAGRSVLLVDLDLHGPGLGTLLDCDDVVGEKGIVTFLSAPDVEPIKNHLITIPNGGHSFDFMGAPVAEEKSAELPTETGPLETRMEALVLQAKGKYDFILVDAASGLSDYAFIAFAISHSVALCFRWSRQHLAGTIRTLGVLCEILDSKDFPLVDFTLIANAVPEASNREQREIVNGVKEAVNGELSRRWGSALMPSRRSIPEMKQIIEIPQMKFWEEIVESKELAKQYEELADYLTKRSELGT